MLYRNIQSNKTMEFHSILYLSLVNRNEKCNFVFQVKRNIMLRMQPAEEANRTAFQDMYVNRFDNVR